MSRTIQSVLLGLFLCAGLLSCEKEYSIENGNSPISSGTAVYTFDGASGACLGPVINGTYEVGTAMNSGNNIILTVNVVTAGTYTISTGSINGVTFSVSSSFATTGPQIVQLSASGTPTAAGSFNYTPGTNGCAFTVTFTGGGTGGGGTSTGTAVYTCNSVIAAGTYTAGSTLGTSNTLTLQVNVQTAGTYTITTGTVNGFSFSGSGNLATGNQSIILTGSGVPTNPGTVSITIGTGCAVTIAVGGTSGGGTGDYLKATIAGTSTNQFNTNLAAYNIPFGTGGVPGGVSVGGESGNESLKLAFTKTSGNVTAGTYNNITASDIANGTYSGVIVQYQSDKNDINTLWQSALLTGNTFTCTILTLTSTKVTGTFSGTLYKTGVGPETKTVTNGTFSVTL